MRSRQSVPYPRGILATDCCEHPFASGSFLFVFDDDLLNEPEDEFKITSVGIVHGSLLQAHGPTVLEPSSSVAQPVPAQS